MYTTLRNDELEVSISPKGAELQSVVCNGTERIWGADPEVWGRKAPLLFPIIGRLRDGYFELGGSRQDHPMHGFCRDRVFEVAYESPTEVVFRTASDDDTRKAFPFDFELEVSFSIDGNVLTKRHVVKNVGSSPMPFEVGGHEAYATRLLSGEHMSDYYIDFGGIDGIEMFQMDADGILGVPKVPVPLKDGRLFNTPEQLGIDTIILERVPGSSVTLGSTKSGLTTTVEFPDFPYLGIWTASGQDDAGYICIEPWSALPDAHFSPRELAEKPGVITLAPGESRTLEYRMSFA